MLDKEKLWIIGYVDIRGLSDDKVKDMMYAVYSSIRFDESVQLIYIPEREFVSKFEVLYNPNSKETAETEKMLEEAKNILDKMIEKYGNKD